MFDDQSMVKIIVSLIIVLTCYFLFFWNFPERFLPRRILKPFTRLIRWAGLDNTWSLFAPNPLSQNLMVGFELEFADGKLQPWTAREFELIDLNQKIPSIRYVRAHRQLVSIFNKTFSRAICRYILRQIRKTEPDTPLPVKIHINRYQEPDNEAVKDLLPWVSYRVYTYDIAANSEEIPEFAMTFWMEFSTWWDQIFFTPVNTLTASMMRVLIGAVMIVDSIYWWRLAPVLLSPGGWYGYQDYHEDKEKYLYFSLLKYLPKSLASVRALLALQMLMAVLMLLGIYANLSAAICFITLVSLHNRNLYVLNLRRCRTEIPGALPGIRSVRSATLSITS